MPLNNYSGGSRLLHKTYLGNYLVAKTSFELEQLIFGKKAQGKPLKEIVFVTGLARAGTTAVFNALYATNSFASLTYTNMPFLLMPNLARSLVSAKPSDLVERAHQDGIMVNNKSPEAFDEYFWKVFLEDAYIKPKSLQLHNVDTALLEQYKSYMQLIAYSNNKNGYLSKNNNNILRVKALLKCLPSAKFVVLYREPLAHAGSLLNQHIHFSELQQKDHFIKDYFNYLGHHEFGLTHKPFSFGQEFSTTENPKGINYWLLIWKNYYSYLLENFDDRFFLISFEDLCENPEKVTRYLNDVIKPEQLVAITEKHSPRAVNTADFDRSIYDDCTQIYDALNLKRGYDV